MAIDEYSKRLSRYCKLEIIELTDEKTPDNASEKEMEQIKEKEGNKILAANPKYVKVIDIPSRKVLAKYEPEETIYSATFLTKNKGAIFTNRGVYEFTF